VKEVIHLHCSFSMKVLNKQTMFMHSQKNMIGGGHKFVFFYINDQRWAGSTLVWWGIFFTHLKTSCEHLSPKLFSHGWGVKIETKMNIKAFASILWWFFWFTFISLACLIKHIMFAYGRICVHRRSQLFFQPSYFGRFWLAHFKPKWRFLNGYRGAKWTTT
jgi:hypothetical protein